MEEEQKRPCVRAKIKRWGTPQCCPIASIPLVEVITEEGLKGLRDCFVYVLSTNRVYYIDSEHRFIICWTGDVFVNDYDPEENKLKLRSQSCYDFANNRQYIFDDRGAYRIIELSAPTEVGV